MREFLRGWRRKIGVMTLLFACALAGVWVRSFAQVDIVEFVSLDRQTGQALLVADGAVTWLHWAESQNVAYRLPEWRSEYGSLDSDYWADPSIEWRVRFCGIGIGSGLEGTDFESISLGWLVIPLTFLSAALLLRTPKSGPKQPVPHA